MRFPPYLHERSPGVAGARVPVQGAADAHLRPGELGVPPEDRLALLGPDDRQADVAQQPRRLLRRHARHAPARHLAVGAKEAVAEERPDRQADRRHPPWGTDGDEERWGRS